MSESTLVVLPATGKVGREVVAALLARGAQVRAVSRALERLGAFPASVERATARFEDVPSLEAVFRGAPRVLFVTPYSESEAKLGENVVEAARRAGVEKLCYVGAGHPDAGAAWLRSVILWGVGIVGPHYKPKFRVEEAVLREPSGIVLQPMNYFQNDEIFRREILEEGTYPQPLGRRKVNRIDVRDIADGASRVLLEPGHEGRAYPIYGLDSLSGPECADVWSEVLGRKIAYAGDDLDAWEKRVEGRMYDKERADIRKTYAFFHAWGGTMGGSYLRRCADLLGRPPRRYRDYVRELAEKWCGGS
jgi:uncharacterized protein YbjT (DUF2867 family)